MTGDEEESPAHAFLAVRLRERSFVVDVPEGESVLIGSIEGALVRIDDGRGDDLDDSDDEQGQGVISWDGHTLTLHESVETPPLFLSGKRLEGRVELKPGDELGAGPAHLVVGVARAALPPGRRALTHMEFKERLTEEMARATRSGRPLALVMAQARAGEGGALLAAALERFRAGDVIATYAHDEVEMLLPDTPRDRASAVMERVASGLSGVLYGIAVAPGDADRPERLFRGARNGMRRALEQAGRVRAPASRPADDGPTLKDPASRALAAELERCAAIVGLRLLLRGEPSSGKVAFARYLHQQSGGGPLVVLACARLGDDAGRRAALGTGGEAFEARGGTLVLDEVTELSREAQRELVAVAAALGHEARIIGTTHRDLPALAARDAFDAELAQVLGAESIHVPPLRKRPDDIVPLARLFAEDAGDHVRPRFSPGALARLRSYGWPGNVLELRNAMERAVVLATGGEVLAEHLPGEGLTDGSDGRLREHVDSVERDAIVKALAESNHNQTHAAKKLGLSRRALIYKMEKYGLKPPPGVARKRR